MTTPLPHTNHARQHLTDWQQAQPTNYFNTDRNLRTILEMYWGHSKLKKEAPRLYRFGGIAATQIDTLVRTSELAGNLPQLQRFDAFGNRLETVTFHPNYHEVGRLIYGSGVMHVLTDAGNNLLALALFYLSAQNGEAGHNCPLACTAGAIKILQAIGSEYLQNTYLPPLLDANYDTHFHAAQFLTEIQGGSDVGANTTIATPVHETEGTWHLTGEKWFCSNVTANVMLVTARVPAQGEGTKGLGLFLVPRHLPNGTLNHFSINRLKDKLGTRAMATGEVEFHNALAYNIGTVQNAFYPLMQHVINTSRIYNAVATTGNARRAYLVAKTYAEHRCAFGHEIMRFPVVQDLLARMRADVAALFAGSFRLAHTWDQIETKQADEQDAGMMRIALNLNKFRSAVIAHEVINHAIELLGGNGAIESFSVLPRLLRDNVVYENWEGTHNVLLAQVQRDLQKEHLRLAFFTKIKGWLSVLQNPPELREQALAELETMQAELIHVLGMDPLTAGIYMRPLLTRLTDLYYTACLAYEAQWELVQKKERSKQRLTLLFFSRRVLKKEAKDIPYYDDLVARIAVE